MGSPQSPFLAQMPPIDDLQRVGSSSFARAMRVGNPPIKFYELLAQILLLVPDCGQRLKYALKLTAKQRLTVNLTVSRFFISKIFN